MALIGSPDAGDFSEKVVIDSPVPVMEPPSTPPPSQKPYRTWNPLWAPMKKSVYSRIDRSRIAPRKLVFSDDEDEDQPMTPSSKKIIGDWNLLWAPGRKTAYSRIDRTIPMKRLTFQDSEDDEESPIQTPGTPGTPPPNQNLLLQMYGDMTRAPAQRFRKKNDIDCDELDMNKASIVENSDRLDESGDSLKMNQNAME